MKKIFYLAMLSMAVMSTSCGTTRTSTASQQPAHQEDAVKQVVDDLKSEGYSPYGSYSMFTLYELVEMTRNKRKEDPERYTIIEGVGEGNDISSSKMFALNNAALSYATQAGSTVTGKMNTQFSNLTESARTKIAGAYTQKVNEYILPSLTENYIIGKREGSIMLIRANYMVDETKAKEARKMAMDEAIKAVAQEVALEQAFMNSVDKLIEDQPIE